MINSDFTIHQVKDICNHQHQKKIFLSMNKNIFYLINEQKHLKKKEKTYQLIGFLKVQENFL
jgi:hypothetical protein